MKIISLDFTVRLDDEDAIGAANEIITLLRERFGFAEPVNITSIPGDHDDEQAISIYPLEQR